MRINSLPVWLALFSIPLQSYAAIGPVEFEQIWWLNNQRNLIARYQQRNELLRRDPRPLYLIDVDSSVNQTIRTSAGEREATLSRLGLHFQNSDYLFMLDWLSLIPQPQTTEGFTYGDLVLARNWQIDERWGIALGGRMQTRPNTLQVAGQTVFNLTDNASHDSVGGFVQLTYGPWNFGSYYSQHDGNQANAVGVTVLESDARTLAATFSHLGGIPERSLPGRNELALDLRENLYGQDLHAGATASAVNGSGHTGLGNVFLAYRYADGAAWRYSGGLYQTRIAETGERLPGFKLGVEYVFDMGGELSLGFSVRRNAFGEIDAMAVRNENVYAFRLQGRAEPSGR